MGILAPISSYIFRVVQEVYDLLQALLGFVLARYIVEFDAGLVVHDVLFCAGFAAAEQHGVAACAAHLLHLLDAQRLTNQNSKIIGRKEMTRFSSESQMVGL